MSQEREDRTGHLKTTLQALPKEARPGETITNQTLRQSDAASLSTEKLPVFGLGEEGDLQLKTLLGAGGMGQVHLAWQRSLARDVAVKTAYTSKSSSPPALLHEALLMGQLEHPNIVPVHALGIDPSSGNPVLVMKRVDGFDWSDLLEKEQHEAWGRLDAGDDKQAFHLQTLIQLCNAVQFAHSRGVLHRDIKPSNVMVGALGEVYLLDWGIATRLVDGKAPSPRLVGTPSFMAPEMINQEEVTPRTDVYLLGGVLHVVLCGCAPHQGESVQEVLLNAVQPKDYTFPEEVPEELAAICRRALSLSPAERFESAGALRAALSAYLRHRSSIVVEQAARLQMVDLEQALNNKDPALARRHFAECQFGFRLALREWPENQNAREALERLLTKMTTLEIQEGQLESAETLYKQLSSPSEELREALSTLRSAKVAARAHQEELERVARQLDLSIGSSARLWMLGVLVLVLALLSALLSFRAIQGDPFTPEMALGASFIPLFLFSMGAGFYWGKLKDPLTRKLLYVVFFSLLCVNINRILAFVQGAQTEQTLQVDMLLLGAILGTAAIAMHSRLWVIAALQFVGYTLAVLFPPMALHIFNITQPITVLLLALFGDDLAKKNKLLI